MTNNYQIIFVIHYKIINGLNAYLKDQHLQLLPVLLALQVIQLIQVSLLVHSIQVSLVHLYLLSHLTHLKYLLRQVIQVSLPIQVLLVFQLSPFLPLHLFLLQSQVPLGYLDYLVFLQVLFHLLLQVHLQYLDFLLVHSHLDFLMDQVLLK